MDKVRNESWKWVATAVNVLIAIFIIPFFNDVRSYGLRLATIEEKQASEPKVHELVAESLKGWTREQVAAALSDVQREIRDLRRELHDKRNAQP